MILFLDTVSPLPEFFLIEDNAIIHSKKILSNQNDKMSDLLIPSYLELEKKYELSSKLKLLLVNTGPGSYTALRVGIAFFSGLSLSYNIKLIGFSCTELFKLCFSNKELLNCAFHIASSNDQNFLCYNSLKLNEFKIQKIEKNINLDKQSVNLSGINRIYTNDIFSENKKKLNPNIEIKVIKFSTLVDINIDKIKKLKNNKVIEAIYVSNNKILN